MAVLLVLFHPEKVLREVAAPVTEITSEIVQLLHDMAETMYAESGIGLAAPQVGISKRLVVIDVEGRDGTGSGNPLLMINPEITQVSETRTVLEEGCLSLPEMLVDVTRPERITMRYTDINGDVQQIEADDLLAKCIQHEIDHLDGRLLFDYLSPLKRDIVLRRYLKQRKAAG